MITDKQVLKYAKEEGYDGIKKLGTWKGYTVYDTLFDGDDTVYAGYPLVILVKGDEIRLSDDEECFEILDYFERKET